MELQRFIPPDPFISSGVDFVGAKFLFCLMLQVFHINARNCTRTNVASVDEAMNYQSVKMLPCLQHPIIRVDYTDTNKAIMKETRALWGLPGKTELRERTLRDSLAKKRCVEGE